jgi:hypothetical protein
MFRDTPKNDAKIKRELIPETDHNNLTVNLESELCMFSNIVGNKAKSLFLLKKAITNGSIIDVSYVIYKIYGFTYTVMLLYNI